MNQSLPHDTHLNTELGQFELFRYPYDKRSPLQAFSTTDEQLIQYFYETFANNWQLEDRIVTVNDAFGALTTACHSFNPMCWSDSVTTQIALEKNLQHNHIDAANIRLVPCTSSPIDETQDRNISVALMLLPKTLSLLEYQLQVLTHHLKPGATVAAGYRVKHFNPSAQALLERYIGPVTGSLTFKKSRFMSARFQGVKAPLIQPPIISQYALENTPFTLTNLPGVFSQQHLDIGTRELLPFIPHGDDALDIIDLGCGNGALSLMAAYRNPKAKVLGVDESYMAVACAQENAKLAELSERIKFEARYGLETFNKSQSNACSSEQTLTQADIILCNPPFHQQNAVQDQTAFTLFKQARDCLKPGGRLFVVGNRHLNYHTALKHLFGNVNSLGGSKKFVVLEAMKLTARSQS